MTTLSSPFLVKPVAVRPARLWPPPATTRLKFTISAASSVATSLKKVIKEDASTTSDYKALTSSAPLPIYALKDSKFRPSPELGLLSILFVLSMATASFLVMAIVSIPTMNAFRKLGISMVKLSDVASTEVPGTLSSFKLSSLEINEVTQKLTNLRNIISGNHGKKEKGSKSGRNNNPAHN